MKNLTKWIGKLLFAAMAIALIVYAASRTLDFVNTTLDAEDQVIGFLALFATTGGALAWLTVYLWNSKGIAQKGIALVMIIIDVIGEISLFTVDTLMRSGMNGLTLQMAPEEIRQTVLLMSLLIGVNIIAIFAFHIMDADNLAEMEIQLSNWQIDKAILDAKKEKATSIASEIAEREAAQYAIEQKAKDRRNKELPENLFSGLFKKKKKVAAVPIASDTAAIPELKEEKAQSASFQETEAYSGGMQDDTGEVHGV